MSGKIYLIQDDETLHALSEQPYASEDRLQFLLAKYPDLLAGDQMNEAAPRRWLLVSREYGVPDAEGGAGRWSLDHLFLDQDGIPTLVEVKRSSDTRARREVVAQMLDYAANGVVYWPVEKIRAEFEAACESEEEAAHQIAALVGSDPQDEATTTAFWSKVKINLQSGRIRMIFVADEIPNELRRIVEFLNEQMDPAEVLAVEVKQFVGENLKTLVPRVVGQTTQAQQRKTGGTRVRRTWDEQSFFQAIESRGNKNDVEVARKIYEWAQKRKLLLRWGTGGKNGSFMLSVENTQSYLCSPRTGYKNGYVEIPFHGLAATPPFDAPDLRDEFRLRLNKIEGVDFSRAVLESWPSVYFANLHSKDALNYFLQTLDWVVGKIREHRAANKTIA